MPVLEGRSSQPERKYKNIYLGEHHHHQNMTGPSPLYRRDMDKTVLLRPLTNQCRAIAFLRWSNIGSMLHTTMAHGWHTTLEQCSFDRCRMVGSTLLQRCKQCFPHHCPMLKHKEDTQ